MSAETSIFDQCSILGAQIRQASGANPFDSVTVDLNANLIEIRLSPAEAAALGSRLDSAEAWRTAFEALHARVRRDFNFDVGESAPPQGETALRVMDDLVTYADECHPEIAL